MSHFTDFTGYVLFIITSFLAGAESTDQCLLNSKVLSCFSGVIMSIRSFFLYLSSLPNKTATASQACKQVYLNYPSGREILSCHGKLHGLVKACLYLQMDGESHGGLYLLFLNQEAFRKLFP